MEGLETYALWASSAQLALQLQGLAQMAREPQLQARLNAQLARVESLAEPPWRCLVTTTNTARPQRLVPSPTVGSALQERTSTPTREELLLHLAVDLVPKENTVWQAE